MTCRGDSARPDHRSPFGRPGWILPSRARRAAWARSLLALSLLGLALALWGGFGAQAAAQAPAAQLESSVVSEGETAVLRIVNAPEAGGHFLHLQPFGDPYTASADDIELRGDNGVAVSPGAAARVTRQTGGVVEFSVSAHADQEAEGGETFGIQLCRSETDCSGEALLGEWTIEITEPAPELGVEQGLIAETELDGPPLGEPSGPVSVLDHLGPDGVYRLRDGGGAIELRLLPSSGAPHALVVGDGPPGGVDLDALAANAGEAYAPAVSGEGLNGTASTTLATPSNWFASQGGQLFLLVGGVNVFFAAHLTESEISAILARHNVPGDRIEPLGELPNAYLIRTASDLETLQLADALASEPGVDSAVPNLYTPLSEAPELQANSFSWATRLAHVRCSDWKQYPDPLSGCLWHLNADTNYRFDGKDPTIDINLGNTWETTMGAGVTVAVIDHTWEGGHPDLKDNVDATRTKHWGGRTGEDPTKRGSYHGTAVAGVIAARDNAVGGRGVAPRATLVNYNFLDEQSSANKIAALTLNKETVAAYNMSFGPGDDVRIARRSDGWRRAVEEGLSSGFGGKGSLYVVAAGNGGRFIGADWATLDEQNNHRGVIATCAVNLYGVAADYSEQGPSLWVCAPSNDTSGRYPGILTTVGAEYYADSFGGTSAAAPIVSGVIALMRSANSDLTWRDVKLILANTAQKNDPTNPGWVSAGDKYGSSGEKYSFNNEYGFGTVDASAAVQAASNWSLLPAEQSAAVASSTVTALPTYGNEIVLTADVTTTIDFVEQVTISITADIFDLRAYRWTLVSPSGTESLLAPEYLNCRSIVCSWIGTFHFGSNRHLGEGGSGAWKVKVRRHDADLTVCGNQVSALHSILCQQMQGIDEEIEAFKLVVYGHKAESGRPVRLSAAPLSVAEGGELSLSVAVDGDPLAADLVIPLQYADSNTTPVGLPGADYGALASITIPAGSTSATAKLAITQDTVYEGAETFVVRLGALPAGFMRAGNPVNVTIADDEPVPTVTLKTSSATVAEGDSTTITASLSHAAEESVTLSLSATPIAPAVAADGSILTHATLTIAGGATSSTGVAAFSSVENALYELSTATAKRFMISAAASGGRGVADPAAITVEIEDDETKPVVSITAGADVTEGGDATFTLTASPKAEADFVVDVFVTVSGDYGVSAGARTVTIPTSGSATLTLPTTDDQVDEPGGSVTASVLSGPDNTPATPSSASVDIADNDDSPSSADYQTVVDLLIDVRDNPANDLVRGNPAHILKWNRVLAAIGYNSGESAMPESEIHAKAAQWPDSPFKQASDYLNSQNQPPTPVVSITGGSGVSEGGDVTFTLTASPAPAADLDVALTIAAVGDYGVAAGSQTVTIPTSGSQTLTIATTDDQTDETDGSVTATLVDGSAYDLGASKTATVSVSDDDLAAPPQTPVVSIAAGGSVTEGSSARFTLTASPAPTQNLNVSLLIGKSGDYGVASGFRTVTIPASGSLTLTIPTTGDEADEADGFVSATLLDGTEYDVGASGSGQVAILDDDDPPPGYTVDPSVVAAVKTLAAQTQHGTAHVNRWQRVLVAFGEHGGTGVAGGAMTAAEAQQMANTYSSPVWDEVVVELTALEASLSAVPVVSIAAGSDISEGGDLTFTLTASPAPAAGLAVTVTIATVGDYGVAAGSRTVTIPASGSQTLTLATTGDQVDEADGSVTATLVDGSAYDLGASKTATVSVSDDDDPPTPVVSISGGAGVTEGGDLTFTLTASPAPAADLDVTVTIATVGDYGVTAGSRTVTIPTSGSQTLTIATAGDQTDEADGSVTATLVDGADYDLGASKTATVAVSDDDDPPPPTPVVSIAAGGSVTEGSGARFTVTASPAPTSNLNVSLLIGKSGDYGVASGFRTVTIPASGSLTLTIPTTGDQADEADGFVSATLQDGAEYDVGTASTGTVIILDDDDPPPQTPVVSISGGAGVSEGGRVTFTLTASPAPAADLDVTVTIAAVGDYGVAAGNRTVTIPASGRVTLTIATTGDQTDEADGSVTATLVDGADYDLGTAKTATVTVSDDDDPPVVVQPVTPVLSACVGEPTLLISSPTASRSDASVDFEVSLDCIPSGRATILVTARRDGVLTEHHYVSLSGEQTSDTVTLQLEGERRLGLALTFERGLANRSAQGDVQFTD